MKIFILLLLACVNASPTMRFKSGVTPLMTAEEDEKEIIVEFEFDHKMKCGMPTELFAGVANYRKMEKRLGFYMDSYHKTLAEMVCVDSPQYDELFELGPRKDKFKQAGASIKNSEIVQNVEHMLKMIPRLDYLCCHRLSAKNDSTVYRDVCMRKTSEDNTQQKIKHRMFNHKVRTCDQLSADECSQNPDCVVDARPMIDNNDQQKVMRCINRAKHDQHGCANKDRLKCESLNHCKFTREGECVSRPFWRWS